MKSVFERIFEGDSTGYETSTRVALLKNIGTMEDQLDGLGFCLSEEDDLLSQWRGYAEDGQGFSIGFSRKYLELLSQARQKSEEGNEQSYSLERVIYDPSKQEQSLMESYNEIKTEFPPAKLKRPRAPHILMSYGPPEIPKTFQDEWAAYKATMQTASLLILKTLPKLFTFKVHAFKEEKEWRLISHLTKSPSDHCLYRAANNKLIPYREFTLKGLNEPAIDKVIIGPKNTTPTFVVEKMLEQYGFNGVDVERSSASYR